MHTAMKAGLTASLATAILSGASGASAQSLNPALNPVEGETRIMAAITVPLGGSRDTARTAPRVEIISRNRTPDGILPLVARDEERRWQERRIGFTLDGSDQLMINGRRAIAADDENRDGISTLGVIGIGVGALLIITVATLADGVDAIEDLTDPD